MGFDSNHHNVLALAACYLAICPLFVALRFSVRAFRKAGFGIDDWLTIPALVMLIGCAVDLIVGVDLKVYGYPTPPPSTPAELHNSQSYNFTKVEQLQFAFLPMHVLSMCFIKLSFIFLFRRIFVIKGVKSRFNGITIAAIVVIIIWTLLFFLWMIFNCGTHFTDRWKTLKTERAACPTGLKSVYGLAISDFITDIMIIALPFPMVLRLNMKTSRKFAVLGAFALGGLTLAASITRFAVFIQKELQSNQALTHQNIDQILVLTAALFWSMLENGLAMIACCLPTLSVLVQARSWRSGSQSARAFISHRFSSTKSSQQSKSIPAGSHESNLEMGATKASQFRPSRSQDSTLSHDSHPSSDSVTVNNDDFHISFTVLDKDTILRLTPNEKPK